MCEEYVCARAHTLIICRERVYKTTHQTVNSGSDLSKDRTEGDFHFLNHRFL